MIATPFVETLVLTNLLLIFLPLGIYQLYRQLISSDGRRYDEGTIKTLQYALGLPALVSLVLLLADDDALNRYSFLVNYKYLASGLLILNAAALITIWSHRILGNHWSGDLETKADHRVVHSGPYRWIRHPLYSSYLFIAVGLLLTTGNWLVSGLVFSYFSAVAARSWKEEEMLSARLGEDYAEYRRRTGRFLPKVILPRSRISH